MPSSSAPCSPNTTPWATATSKPRVPARPTPVTQRPRGGTAHAVPPRGACNGSASRHSGPRRCRNAPAEPVCPRGSGPRAQKSPGTSASGAKTPAKLRSAGGAAHAPPTVLVAGRAGRPGFRFIDAQGTSAEADVIQRFNGGISVAVFHFHKPKAAGTTGFPVADEFHAQDVAVFGKKILNLFLSCRPGKIPHINRLGHETPSRKTKFPRVAPGKTFCRNAARASTRPRFAGIVNAMPPTT